MQTPWTRTPELKVEPGDVLVNVSDIVPDFESLHKKFDIIDFFDLCSLIETVVIHNRLICLGPNADPGNTDLIVALCKQDIIDLYAIHQDYSSAFDILEHEASKKLLGFIPRYIGSDDYDLFPDIAARTINIIMDVFLEKQLDISLALSAHTLPIYVATNFNSEDEKLVRQLRGSLSTIYEKVSADITSRIRRLEREPVLIIPPIALEVLGAAENLQGILYVLLDTRLQYEKLRTRIAEIDSTLRSPDLSFEARFKEEAKLLKAVKELLPDCKPEELSYFTETGAKLVEAVKSEISVEGIGFNALDATKLVSVLAKVAEKFFWESRMGPLHTTRRRYLQYSASDINKITQRLFGHELTRDDIRRAERYEAVIRKWKQLSTST